MCGIKYYDAGCSFVMGTSTEMPDVNHMMFVQFQLLQLLINCGDK